MKMKLITAGKEACSAYFEKSGIRYGQRLDHTPFVVFSEQKDAVTVDIVDNAQDLITYPVDTKVMAQWAGRDRSDFFRFTVGDLRKHIKANPPRSVEAV